MNNMTCNPFCGECGSALLAFEDETFRIEHRDYTYDVSNLSGWRCSACGDVVFSPDSAARYAATGDALVLTSMNSLPSTDVLKSNQPLSLK